LIVGGGPGGLETARVAVLRGHDVTVMEKEAELGGNLKIAALPIGKGEFKTYFVDWLESQCKKTGVNIELNKEATPEIVKAYKPDVVIVATGASPLTPDIPGITKPHVVTAVDVLTGKAQIGKKVVVAGGGQIGAETADFIAEKGLAESVTIVEMLPMIAMDMDSMNMSYFMMNIVPKYGLQSLVNMKISEIMDDGLLAIDKDWKQHNIEADTVVIAMGYTSNRAIYDALKGEVPELYIIGDSAKPRKIVNAVHEGAYIARQI
jgi:pyruvate/2-oxoglutarate dehydrogenase complex dihydrolipoamide dehydrogenase (E3) component